MSTRDRILESADRLFYQRGFDHTSVADIADDVQIARGNLTFHFKTRDMLLTAVIDRRLQHTQELLEQWEAAGDSPADRIRSFINILIMNRTKILLHGCPVGTLCSELAKLEHHALTHASQLFTLFRNWLGRQFMQAGHDAEESRHLAMHLLAWSQGIATLANAFHDEGFLREEVRRLDDWLTSLTAKTSRKKAAKPRVRRRP